MSSADEAVVLKALQVIPGVGKSIARDLYRLDIHAVTDLVGQDPETLYVRHCEQQGMPVDRCVLYVFRCAVYFAETENPDPDKLNWWNWKDRQ